MVTNVRHRHSFPPSFVASSTRLSTTTTSSQTRREWRERHHARPGQFLLLYGFNKSPRGDSRRAGSGIKPPPPLRLLHDVTPRYGKRNDSLGINDKTSFFFISYIDGGLRDHTRANSWKKGKIDFLVPYNYSSKYSPTPWMFYEDFLHKKKRKEKVSIL